MLRPFIQSDRQKKSESEKTSKPHLNSRDKKIAKTFFNVIYLLIKSIQQISARNAFEMV